MKLIKRTVCILAVLLSVIQATAVERQKLNFNGGWLLNVGDTENAQQASFDDRAWLNVTLPRAWNDGWCGWGRLCVLCPVCC